MTVRKIIKKYPELEIELLLARAISKPKEFLFLNPNHQLSGSQFKRLAGFIQRRQKGEPIAYILGNQEFMGLNFKVNSHTLIPRPDTEAMVERVVSLVKSWNSKKRKIKILDVGTGSGCIAIALAKFLGKQAEVAGSDISGRALLVARQNARRQGLKIRFYKSNLLNNIKGDFDVVVANLPYGWKAWKNNTRVETLGLKFEPQIALFTSQSGLREITRLTKQVAALKQKPKAVFLEFDPRQKARLGKIAKHNLPLGGQVFHKDLSGRFRFLELLF
ncbi:MAG: peptide chain release factor N(5)-glutamine methyltransferase [Patescibacteria group bacterium]|nr:peptide chain release factor N(5)-glutamine methyltransferase [Patescibacteria group bacterium]